MHVIKCLSFSSSSSHFRVTNAYFVYPTLRRERDARRLQLVPLGELRVRGVATRTRTTLPLILQTQTVQTRRADPVSKGAAYTFGSDSSWVELTDARSQLTFSSQVPVEQHIGTRDPGSSYTGLAGWYSTETSGRLGPQTTFSDLLAHNALLFCYDSRRGGHAGMRCGALGQETPYQFWQSQGLYLAFKQFRYSNGFPERKGLAGVETTTQDPYTYFTNIVNDWYFAGDICIRFLQISSPSPPPPSPPPLTHSRPPVETQTGQTSTFLRFATATGARHANSQDTDVEDTTWFHCDYGTGGLIISMDQMVTWKSVSIHLETQPHLAETVSACVCTCAQTTRKSRFRIPFRAPGTTWWTARLCTL